MFADQDFNISYFSMQESRQRDEGDEAATGHVQRRRKGATRQSPADGCRTKDSRRGRRASSADKKNTGETIVVELEAPLPRRSFVTKNHKIYRSSIDVRLPGEQARGAQETCRRGRPDKDKETRGAGLHAAETGRIAETGIIELTIHSSPPRAISILPNGSTSGFYLMMERAYCMHRH